jgi:Protein kinase domain
MGEVWRAYDTETDRIVALKLLPEHWVENSQFQQRFRREAHMAARLNNPHVVPIHHYGEIDGRLYVDMRLIEGRDLGSILANGPLTPRLAVGVIGQIAKALHAAHKVGLVHRDVKPSNILLAEDDFAYLIDFGIARAVNESGLTSAGAVIGTWQYMAPERLSDRESDSRSDVYALTCVLHETLTGRPPFPGDSLESQVAAHLTAPPPQPSHTAGNVPPQFDAVIAKGMAKDPETRYATTTELAQAAYEAAVPPAPILPTHNAPTHDAHWLTPTLAGHVPGSGHGGDAHSVATGTSMLSRVRRLWAALDTPRRLIVGLVVVVVATAAAAGLLSRLGSGYETVQAGPTIELAPSAEEEVRTTIQDFDGAIQNGDLTTLRELTCGTTHDSYANYDEQAWAETHARVAAGKLYPVVASIDQVNVNGDHAEANVTTFMAYEPQTRSTRSFDLQRVDNEWKICRSN